jgi:hypothetical protein
MRQDGFAELVTTEWNAIQDDDSTIDRDGRTRSDILDNIYVVGKESKWSL